jgi:hypothetical protein
MIIGTILNIFGIYIKNIYIIIIGQFLIGLFQSSIVVLSYIITG